ncbi:MAG: hypothetical protein JSR82_06765 [Verrucomicrobia bacterium]|nr:hypothetical protein [Verrucomicrobiota bacterium]
MSSRSTPVPLSRTLIVALLCEGLLVGPLIAQNPPAFQPPPPPATATAVPPAPATGNPPVLPGAPGTPGAIGTDGEEMVQLQLPNFDVRDVLQFYERLTGKRLVLDSTIQGQLNVVVQGKISKSEAIKILETALLLNGFSIVPGDGITKVLGLSKNARGAGVSIYSELGSLPDGELVVSYLFRLRYLDPTELQQILQQYVTANLYTSFVALPKSGALLVTESTSVIRKLVQLVREVDLPPADVIQEFVQLQRADATKAVEFLNAVFEKKEAAAAAGGAGRAGAPRRPTAGTAANPAVPVPPVAVPAVLDTQAAAAAVAALTEDSIIVGKIALNADIRTNRVHVVTRPVNMPFVRRLIADYDSSTVFATPVKRRLNHINARDVLPILIASLTEPGTDAAGGAQGGARPAATTTNPGGNTSLFANQGNRGGTTGSTGSSGGGLNLTQGLETAPVDTTPTTATVGNTKLIADPRENSIIVQGSSEARDRCFKILEELDVEAPQVAIYAVIGEFSLGDGISSGIDYILNRAGPITTGSNFTGLVQGTSTTTNGNTTTSASGFDRGNPPVGTPVSSVTNLANTLLSGFNGAGAIIRATDRFDIILRALESSNRFKTISRPMIFTSNNKKAVIASGQEIAIPANFTSGFTGSANNSLSTTASVQFKSVTLQLEVVPLINSKNRVNLDILQKIDSVVAGGGTTVAGTTIPTIATRFVRSNVSVPNLGTVVLGGLIQADESKTNNGLPLLSRIPVLGNLFKSQTSSNNRRELIILLRPVVTNTDLQIARNRKVVEDEMYMGDNLEGQLQPYFKKKDTIPLRPGQEVRKAVPVATEPRTTVKVEVQKKKVVKPTPKPGGKSGKTTPPNED